MTVKKEVKFPFYYLAYMCMLWLNFIFNFFPFVSGYGNQGYQKVPATSDIAGYFEVFTG